MEHSIQEVARAAGTTSRTLRHYDRVGLVPPSRIGSNGYRYYDDRALVRLQRVLLLRELGLGLNAIGEVLAAQDAQTAASTARRGTGRENGHADGRAAAADDGDPALAEARILRSHLELLEQESQRIAAQIGAVERTIAALEAGAAGAGSESDRTDDNDDGNAEERGDLMSQNMFEGFDHTRYRDEVEERWGKTAYAESDRWWRSLGTEGQAEWQERVVRLSADWGAAAERGEDPEGEAARDLARRHVEWLRSVPGTPAHARGGDLAGYVRGLAEMYVADERFAANYGGNAGAVFVRDALRAYVEKEL